MYNIKASSQLGKKPKTDSYQDQQNLLFNGCVLKSCFHILKTSFVDSYEIPQEAILKCSGKLFRIVKAFTESYLHNCCDEGDKKCDVATNVDKQHCFFKCMALGEEKEEKKNWRYLLIYEMIKPHQKKPCLQLFLMVEVEGKEIALES